MLLRAEAEPEGPIAIALITKTIAIVFVILPKNPYTKNLKSKFTRDQ